MEHAREVLQIILVTRDQATIILEPCEQPLSGKGLARCGSASPVSKPRMVKILERPENQKSAMMNSSHEG
jgi:hypothetical protein